MKAQFGYTKYNHPALVNVPTQKPEERISRKDVFEKNPNNFII